MNSESFSSKFFRFLWKLALLAGVAMFYWSSLLVEERLRSIQLDLSQMKAECFAIKQEFEKERAELLRVLKNTPSMSAGSRLHENRQGEAIAAVSPDNILQPDPFYDKTLPELLGPDFKPQGIRKEAIISKPDNLHPFSNWYQISIWNGLCNVGVAGLKFGVYETFVPNMGISMELKENDKGEPEYWIQLRKDVYWHPLNPAHFSSGIELAPFFLHRHQVTAHDFKFYYDAVMNPHVEQQLAVALRLLFNEIEEFRVVDDFQFVVRWKTEKIADADGKETLRMRYLSKFLTASLQPLASFVYKYFADGTKILPDDSDPNAYQTSRLWAQNFAQHWAQQVIVSCGAWLFDGMTDREIRFRRNPNYYDPYAVLVEAYEVKFRDTPEAIWEEFKTGSIDLFQVPPNLLGEFDLFLQSYPYQQQKKEGLGVQSLQYLARNYSYIGWNEKNALFNSKKVRQALTMAIDRERIIRQNLNGMAIQPTGPFSPSSPSYDLSLKPYPFDPDRSLQLLQEEGWYDQDGDGILDKEFNGQRLPFRFKLKYYVKNPIIKAVCDYIATALKHIGIDCQLTGVDTADLSAIFDDKDFDAVAFGWALGTPPEDPRPLWYSTGATEKGSSNAIGFSNAEVDQILDALEYEYDPKKRLELYHRFDAIIYDEAPYTFLYAPKYLLAYRSYLQNVFIPADRQDLIPGANVGEPQSSIYWIKEENPL